jgi:hypothetical protein
MKQQKRILTVVVERMDDTDPDTSWLGEYSAKRASEFSIDRAHADDCQTQSPAAKEAIERLERAIRYLDIERLAQTESCQSEPNGRYMSGIWADSIGEAQDLLIAAQDELVECDCGRGTWDRREYRYFNPSQNYVDEWGELIDENTAEEVRKYVAQDYARMEGLQAGEWGFIGIRAKAEIAMPNGGHTSAGPTATLQTITSGGLWGIESDSEEDYLKVVEGQELADLRTQLYALGFGKRAIAAAVRASVG